MKRKINILSIILFLFFGTIDAQYNHEFSVYGGGGLSALNYKATIGDQKLGLGGHFGLGYHFFFSPKWGLGTGAELGFYRSKFNMDNMKVSYMTTDMNGDAFEFRSTVSDYKENQNAMLLQIPLMLQFQTGGKQKFYVAAGGKAGIPMKEKYSNTASFTNVGYYVYENSLYDTQEFMGFGSFPDRKNKGDLDFKNAFFLSAETGVKWRLNEKCSLYTGVYLDYGLNNIVETGSAPSLPTLVEYNRVKPTEFVVNSIFQSQYTQDGGASQAFTNKITPIAAGIKVRLAFGKNRGQTKTQPEPSIPPVINDQRSTCDEIQKALDETRKALADCDAARKAAEDAVGKAEAARKAAEAAASKAKDDELNAVKKLIEQPIDHYALNQTKPAAFQKQRLDEKIALLKQYPNLRFYIYGHTCNIGTKNANERVGTGRDAEARAYLISKGIDESRILGNENKRDSQPVAPNTDEASRKLNRRVQIVVQ